MRLAAPALAYFGLVFAIGFGLGAVRMFWLAPQVGALMAGVIELPVILFASWLVATWLVRHFALAPGRRALSVGALALALLLLAELALTRAMGGTVAAWLDGLARPEGLLGLAGQVVFALMPHLAARRSSAA